jgi:3-hydroxy-9,10-secoandrosta-1,3,5(10)-triene-9,17-dione monooxygenase reductase component
MSGPASCDAVSRPGLPRVSRAPHIDASHFRRVLGLFATGVVAVTAADPRTGRPVGVTANSFTAVSLDPPLVSVCMACTSTTWPRIRAARGLCISILADDQPGLGRQLAAVGGDRFREVDWTASPAGHPILTGGLGWLECSVEAEHRAGDHVIAICRVRHLDLLPGRGPLVFYRGRYGRFDGSTASPTASTRL